MNPRAPLPDNRPLIVATADSPEALSAARSAHAFADLVELRIDALIARDPSPERWAKRAQAIATPLVVTVRHRDEGGACTLAPGARRDLFHRFIPQATLIDIELRHAFKLADVLAAARLHHVGVILSSHHFLSTPSLSRLRDLHRAARDLGADVFKIASRFRSTRDLQTLLALLDPHPAPHVAAMGMGPLGAASRPALALAGSRLNYGYLHTPTAPGQWPARLLADTIRISLDAPPPAPSPATPALPRSPAPKSPSA